jgi:hypothetical protein
VGVCYKFRFRREDSFFMSVSELFSTAKNKKFRCQQNFSIVRFSIRMAEGSKSGAAGAWRPKHSFLLELRPYTVKVRCPSVFLNLGRFDVVLLHDIAKNSLFEDCKPRFCPASSGLSFNFVSGKSNGKIKEQNQDFERPFGASHGQVQRWHTLIGEGAEKRDRQLARYSFSAFPRELQTMLHVQSGTSQQLPVWPAQPVRLFRRELIFEMLARLMSSDATI